MSDLLGERPVMPPQISPKDIPRGGENSDSEEDEPIPPVILENSSSSDEDADNMEDEEEDVNQGYVQLAQDESEDQQTTEESSPQAEEQGSEVDSEPDTDNASSNSLSSSTPVRSTDPEMKQEQVDLIRQVMSGITLPTSAVPEWAKVVPEEKWKASLVSSIENRTTSPPGSAKID